MVKIPKLPRFKKLLSQGDAKQRAFIIVIGMIVAVLAIIFIVRILTSGSDDSAAYIRSAPNVSSIQGGKVSDEYRKALQQGNAQRATRAQLTGTSALPTVINTGQFFAAGGTDCVSCCNTCSEETISGIVNKLLNNGKISPATQQLLDLLGDSNLSPEEYAAQLQRLVAEGKLTPEQARALLSAYNATHAQALEDLGASTLNDFIKNGNLPLSAADALMELQKAGASVDDYQQALQRLVNAGIISPATAKALLDAYKKQKQQQLTDETQGQLDAMAASDGISDDVAKTLSALQKSNVPVEDYAVTLQRLVDEGKLTPEQAKRLLAQYKKLHGIEDSNDAGVTALNNEMKLSQAAGDVLQNLQRQHVSVEIFAGKLQNLVQANTISGNVAQSLLAQYQKEYQAKSVVIEQLQDLQSRGLLFGSVASALVDDVRHGLSDEEFNARLQQFITQGSMGADLAGSIKVSYQQAYLEAVTKDQLIERYESEPRVPSDVAAALRQMQFKGASVSDYANYLQDLVNRGIISPETAKALLEAYKKKLAQAQTSGALSGSAIASNIPGSNAFANVGTSGGSTNGNFQQLQNSVGQQRALSQQAQLAAQSARQNDQQSAAQQQIYQQQLQEISQRMSQQAQQLLSDNWEPVAQAYVAGIKPITAAGSGSGSGGVGGTLGGAPLIKAGAIYYAVLDTAVNSDYAESPVMATIVAGPYKGAKLMGKVGTVSNGQRVLLQFSLMTEDSWPTGLPIDAYAIDPDTARTAMATSVNNHYLMRYGTLFATSFLSGMAEAIMASGETVTSDDGVVTATTDELTTEDKVLIALGQVGEDAANELGGVIHTPPTVKVKAGVGIGILFMTDVGQNGAVPASGDSSGQGKTLVDKTRESDGGK